jgi:hypothetical protein
VEANREAYVYQNDKDRSNPAPAKQASTDCGSAFAKSPAPTEIATVPGDDALSGVRHNRVFPPDAAGTEHFSPAIHGPESRRGQGVTPIDVLRGSLCNAAKGAHQFPFHLQIGFDVFQHALFHGIQNPVSVRKEKKALVAERPTSIVARPLCRLHLPILWFAFRGFVLAPMRATGTSTDPTVQSIRTWKNIVYNRTRRAQHGARRQK